MSQLLIKSQDIRYTKLTFVVQFTEDTMLPKQKVSAIRGGIGEMLLRANCVRGANVKNVIFQMNVLCSASCILNMKRSHLL